MINQSFLVAPWLWKPPYVPGSLSPPQAVRLNPAPPHPQLPRAPPQPESPQESGGQRLGMTRGAFHGDIPKMEGLFSGQSHRSKWMMTGGLYMENPVIRKHIMKMELFEARLIASESIWVIPEPGTPKWFVHSGTSHLNGCFRGTSISGMLEYDISTKTLKLNIEKELHIDDILEWWRCFLSRMGLVAVL